MKNCGAKIKDLIRSITNSKLDSKLNSFHKTDNYGEKYMKIKFNLVENLPLKKTLKRYNIIMVLRSVFHEVNPQVFLN